MDGQADLPQVGSAACPSRRLAHPLYCGQQQAGEDADDAYDDEQLD
jgi:hypothetical protein